MEPESPSARSDVPPDKTLRTQTVQTVLGPIPLDKLGWTLPHEHFFIKAGDGPGMALRDPEIAALELRAARAEGTRTVVDLTTIDIGRDPHAIRELSRSTGVNIVMGTGWYLHRTYPDRISMTSTASLAEELIRDIEVGIDGIRPGVIGEIGTLSTAIDAREERVLRAVARAHRRTGLPIFVHQQRVYSAPFALEILVEEGVAEESVILCHMDSIDDPNAVAQALRLGSWLAFDRLQGWELVHQGRPWEIDRRVELVLQAKRSGYLDRILVSTDCCVLGDLGGYGGPGYGFTHGPFARRLLQEGLGQDDLDQLFQRNPAHAIRPR